MWRAIFCLVTLASAVVHAQHRTVRSAGEIENAKARCKWDPDPGPCRAFFRRYYYNHHTHACETFVYGGCDGCVPFRTSHQCESARCHLTMGDSAQMEGEDASVPFTIVELFVETIIDYL